LKQLTIENVRNSKLEKPGVYFIYLCDSNGSINTVNRLCKLDTDGLLYIGAAEKTFISYRLTNFIYSMDVSRKQNNHSAGRKLCENLCLRNWVSNYCLYFDVVFTTDAKSKETWYLTKYKAEFGELPPLNG
jgi:hypothetical protein